MPVSDTRSSRCRTFKFKRICGPGREAFRAAEQSIELVGHPMLRPVNVATAAPVTPMRKRSQTENQAGINTRLMMFDTQSSRMGIAAPPAAKIALLKQ